jgi:hypothetical protein
MRRVPPDYLLLTLFSAAALVFPVGLLDPTGTGDGRLTFALWNAVRGAPGWGESLSRALVVVPILSVPAAAVGWWAQAAAVRCGLRLTGRPNPEAADYRDAAPRPPRRRWSVRRKVAVWLAVVAAAPLAVLGLFYLLVYLNS